MEENKEKVKEISFDIKNTEGVKKLIKFKEQGYPFLEKTETNNCSFLLETIIYNKKDKLLFLLENFDWDSSLLKEEINAMLYVCVDKETGKLNRDISKIILEYIPFDKSVMFSFFSMLIQFDSSAIGFLIDNGLSLLPDKNTNNESDDSIIKSIIIQGLDLKMYQYLEENGYCSWSDELLNEPLLYYIIRGFHAQQKNLSDFELLKRKLLYFIEKGCSLDKKINFFQRNELSVKDYFFDLIEEIPLENKEIFSKIFSEVSVFNEKKRILAVVNSKRNPEKNKKIKRL